MAKPISPTELLAQEFLQRVKTLHAEIEPLRVLKARAYRISSSHVLIRAASEGSKRYFFGLNYITAEEVANLDNAFFAFICGSVERTLIIPAYILMEHLPLISHDRNGEYKITIDENLDLVLAGRGNRLDSTNFINALDLLLKPPKLVGGESTVEESLHSVVQGRLLEIGNIRGYQTFCPNKSKSLMVDDLTTLQPYAFVRSYNSLNMRHYDR